MQLPGVSSERGASGSTMRKVEPSPGTPELVASAVVTGTAATVVGSTVVVGAIVLVVVGAIVVVVVVEVVDEDWPPEIRDAN